MYQVGSDEDFLDGPIVVFGKEGILNPLDDGEVNVLVGLLVPKNQLD
jgi:hypothetical protein